MTDEKENMTQVPHWASIPPFIVFIAVTSIYVPISDRVP